MLISNNRPCCFRKSSVQTFSAQTLVYKPSASLPVGKQALLRKKTNFIRISAVQHEIMEVSHNSPGAISEEVTSVLPHHAATQISEAAQQAGKPGFMDGAALAIEHGLQFLSDRLDAAHVPYSFGFSIILSTCLLKLAMYPMIEQQVRFPSVSRHLAPAVAALKARYESSEPERFKRAVAQLHAEYGVSPGLMIVQNLATLPVFFVLFKALRRAAADGAMDEPFFFVPSLAGPHQEGMSGLGWLLPFENGQPPIGWPAALSYLVIPVALVLLSVASQEEIFTPKERRVRSGGGAMKLLSPLLMGWFSLQVPAGLSLYWLTNAAVTTAIEARFKAGPAPPPVDLNKFGISEAPKTAALEEKAAAAPVLASGSNKSCGTRFRALKAEEESRKLVNK